MPHSRRSLLSAIGALLPFGLAPAPGAFAGVTLRAPQLSFRPFEDGVREAFTTGTGEPLNEGGGLECRRVEIGQSDVVNSGVQGCYNEAPFAGFPAGSLKIIRVSSEPGPLRQGVRLYMTSVDVTHVAGGLNDRSGRPLDFASLPPAPFFG